MESLKSRAVALLGACALLIALLAGCGGGDATTVDRTVTVTDSTETSSPPAEAASGGTETEVTGAGSPRALHLSVFQSPSGNIGCALLGGIARCDISKRSWSPPRRPPGCPDEVDFGQGLQVGRNDHSGSFVCAGDTALNPQAAKLAYGSDDRSGGFLCSSRAAGITCRNAGGHGFFISIQSYRAF